MASKKKIADLSAVLTADIKQFDAEMKRASTLTKAAQGNINNAFDDLQRRTNASLNNIELKSKAAFSSISKEASKLQGNVAGSTRGLGAEIEKLSKKLTDEFSAVKFGKAFLSGLGIGGALAAVDFVMEKFSDLWQESAKHAAEVEERAKSIQDIISKVSAIRLDIADSNRGPLSKIAFRETEVAKLQQQMVDLEKEREAFLADAAAATERNKGKSPLNQGSYTLKDTNGKFILDRATPRAYVDYVIKKADEAQQKWAEASLKVAELKKEIDSLRAPDKTAAIDNELQSFFGPLDEQSAQMAQDVAERQKQIAEAVKVYDQNLRASLTAEQANGEARRKANAETAKLAEEYRKISDPAARFKDQLAQIADLQAKGALSAEDAARAIGEVNRQIRAAQTGAINEQLQEFFGPLDESSDSMKNGFHHIISQAQAFRMELVSITHDAGDGMASAFVESINGVEGAFTDLRKMVVREIEMMIAKILIITPLMQAIGAGFNLLGWGTLGSGFASYGATSGAVAAGGMFADGGRPPMNKVSVVGDGGEPELFVPDTAGTIIPFSKLGSGGSAEMYNFTYNIAADVSRSELMQILKAQERHTVAAVEEARRRRKIA